VHNIQLYTSNLGPSRIRYAHVRYVRINVCIQTGNIPSHSTSDILVIEVMVMVVEVMVVKAVTCRGDKYIVP
jgi:hypothetical protein